MARRIKVSDSNTKVNIIESDFEESKPSYTKIVSDFDEDIVTKLDGIKVVSDFDDEDVIVPRKKSVNIVVSDFDDEPVVRARRRKVVSKGIEITGNDFDVSDNIKDIKVVKNKLGNKKYFIIGISVAACLVLGLCLIKTHKMGIFVPVDTTLDGSVADLSGLKPSDLTIKGNNYGERRLVTFSGTSEAFDVSTIENVDNKDAILNTERLKQTLESNRFIKLHEEMANGELNKEPITTIVTDVSIDLENKRSEYTRSEYLNDESYEEEYEIGYKWGKLLSQSKIYEDKTNNKVITWNASEDKYEYAIGKVNLLDIDYDANKNCYMLMQDMLDGKLPTEIMNGVTIGSVEYYEVKFPATEDMLTNVAYDRLGDVRLVFRINKDYGYYPVETIISINYFIGDKEYCINKSIEITGLSKEGVIPEPYVENQEDKEFTIDGLEEESSNEK